jgi:diguanylate cyclase (GGDEF)-like protein/PAS domain S-box-containing protein
VSANPSSSELVSPSTAGSGPVISRGGVPPRFDDSLETLGLGAFRVAHDNALVATNTTFRSLMRIPDAQDGTPPLRFERLCARPEEGTRLIGELAVGELRRNEVELLRVDGTSLWGALTLVRQADGSGRTVVDGTIEDVTERRAINDIVEQIATSDGEGFLRWLVRHLAQSLGARLVVVARVGTSTAGSVSTIAVWRAGEFVENFSYSLAGAPCERVLREEICCYRSGVASVFPDSTLLACLPGADSYVAIPLLFDGSLVGLLAVVDTEPLSMPLRTSAVLQQFARRAGDVLGRSTDDSLARQPAGFLQHALDSLKHPFYVIDVADYRLRTANAAARFGPLTPGSRCYELTHGRSRPCDGSDHPCPIEEVRRTLRPVTIEHTHADAQHRERIFEVHAHPILDTNGELHQIIEYNLDITDRRVAEAALRSSELQFRHLYDSSPALMFSIGADGRICDANRRLLSVAGYPREDLIGQPADFLVSPTGPRSAAAFLTPGFWRTGHFRDMPFELLAKDGTPIEVQLTCVATTRPDGQRVNIVSALDVTSVRQAERARRTTEERYALVASGANDGLWEWDLSTEDLILSARWLALLGYSPGELGARSSEWLDRLHPEDRERFVAALSLHRDGLTPEFTCEHRLLHRDGRYRWFRVRGLALRDRRGQSYRMAGSLTDISSRRAADARLQEATLRDSVTDLPTRALFLDRLAKAASGHQEGEPAAFAILLIDIDRFRLVAETHGESSTDPLLASFADRLRACVFPGDTLARLREDQFAILSAASDDLGALTAMTERIQRAVSRPFQLGHDSLTLTISVGVAVANGDGNRPEEILRRAAVALERAKAQGGNQHAVYEPRHHARFLARRTLEADLRLALEREEFILHYQPIFSLGARRSVGLEALARWKRPDNGLVLPDHFVPVLEQTGLIHSFGLWVLDQACRRAAAGLMTHDAPWLWMSVNVSATQLLREELPTRIEEALAETHLSPDRLALEITEGVIMDDPEATSRVLSQLKDIGVQLFIDDFGTGYSSLSYLHRFPFDALKIPCAFVREMHSGRGTIEIVRTIIRLAQSLDMAVIAEGVETEEQAQQLLAWGCELGQGYLFAAPTEALGFVPKTSGSPGNSGMVLP